jgi:hypothetical protein
MRKIWHPWHLWECCKAGLYLSCADTGTTKEDAQEQYRVFLSDIPRFEEALIGVTSEWRYSCEHFLTDTNRNRIAWLGQASMAYAAGIPSEARGGFKLLTEQQQKDADALALKYLKIWENENTDNGIYKQMELPGIPR